MTDDPTMQTPTPGGEGARGLTLTLSEAEREVVALALGELLSSVRREEHLVPTIRALLRKVQPPERPAP